MASISSAIKLFRSLHIGRIVPEVDPVIEKQINERALNPKRLPTRRNVGLTRLPVLLELAAQKKILQKADTKFRSEASQLLSIMQHFKLPDDKDTIRQKKADIKTQLEIRDKIKLRPDYEPDEIRLKEEVDVARHELVDLINGTLEERRRDWHYYEYDEYASNLYMATRLAPNYAAIRTVMKEIHDLCPDFRPETVLDFGSGMGTTIWAVNETWPDAVGEFMNIELSKDQQYLCEYLLRGGKEFGDNLSNVYHRQYLPSSNKAKYDMTVASYSLLELPNFELRAQTIENLWHQTKDLLVIVERGNKGGFTTINEARHFVLDNSGYDVTKRRVWSDLSQPSLKMKSPGAHVIAPCSHEFLCPRTSMPSRKNMDVCRFRVVFEPLNLGQNKGGFAREDFSYVVLRKGPHPSYNSHQYYRYPRVVEKRKHSGGQITHKLCCPNGCLAESVITKKYGRAAYEVAKSCDWGDILPIKAKDTYI